MAYYSTPQEVIRYTGVRPADFEITAPVDGKTPEELLEEVIEGWLEQAKNFIDADRNRNFTAEGEVPAGIHNIALRLVANMVAQAQIRRQTPIVRHDDFTVQMVEDTIFTSSIKFDLARFPYKHSVRFHRVGSGSSG